VQPGEPSSCSVNWLNSSSATSVVVGCTATGMPPQRRKFTIDAQLEDENKTSPKRLKNNMHSGFGSRRSSKQTEMFETGGFSQKKCVAFFNEYVSPGDTDIGPEGIEKFCEDLQVEPENIVMLVLAWKMDAKRMGYFTLREWMKGMQELQCDSTSKVRNKLDYLRSLLNDQSNFKNIYRYAFDFAKDKDQRSCDIETAKAMLQLLLGKHWPLFPSFYQFLDQSKYKVINKDQWCNVLEFSRSININLTNYDEDGAWPVLLDEFVDWYRRSIQLH